MFRFALPLAATTLSTVTAFAQPAEIPCFPGPVEIARAPLSRADAARARNPFPGDAFKGLGPTHMTAVLNNQLKSMASRSGLKLAACDTFSAADLHEIQRVLVHHSHSTLQSIYEANNDNRRFRFCSLTELEEKYAVEAAVAVFEYHDVLRDSKCREAVMWYVHHLGDEEKTSFLAGGHTLPMLPTSPERGLEQLEAAAGTSVGSGSAQVILKAANESLQCTTCHNFHPNHTWPSGAGVNPKTGKAVPDWPDDFEVDFFLEVTTEPGQKGLGPITNASGNTLYYHYNRSHPEESRALNRHRVQCPFFPTVSCDIYHQPDGIYLHISPGSVVPICCKAFPVPPIPPYWTKWGRYYGQYQPGQEIGSGQVPLWEGFESDRYIFGELSEHDMHDNIVRSKDPSALVRFHATIPPPNDHSHGYWHVTSDMKKGRQPDMTIFDRPRSCLPTCSLSEEHKPPSGASTFMPWPSITHEHIQGLRRKMA